MLHCEGEKIINAEGKQIFLRGTNLGGWLLDELWQGFFKGGEAQWDIVTTLENRFGKHEADRLIKIREDNYITEYDLDYLQSLGFTSVRVPFWYRNFQTDDNGTWKRKENGEIDFSRLDWVVEECSERELYVILDMHDAPGGQTGDNIDDSYGYPWLLESEASQQLFCDIWKRIAEYYKNEPVVIAYDLINEPIAPYFENVPELNAKLEPLHKRVTAAIREVDPNHIIMIGAPQWNSNFDPFTDWTYDDNMMYSCHRYGGDACVEAIGNFIAFRDKTNLPMYMGEIGHNTDEWQEAFCIAMEQSNIGYTFWPYKKIRNSCFNGITPPENWDKVMAFSEAPRTTYFEVRDFRPDQAVAREAMLDFIEACKFDNCIPQEGYINSLRLNR